MRLPTTRCTAVISFIPAHWEVIMRKRDHVVRDWNGSDNYLISEWKSVQSVTISFGMVTDVFEDQQLILWLECSSNNFDLITLCIMLLVQANPLWKSIRIHFSNLSGVFFFAMKGWGNLVWNDVHILWRQVRIVL